jgi:zinc protease
MVRVPAHARVELDNGAVLILLPRRDVPLVACQVFLRGGACGDPPALPGVASLVAALLEKGAGPRDAYAFAEAVEGAGGSFTAAAGPEAIAVRSQFMARDQGLMLELLGDALRAPRLASEEFMSLRDRQIEFIKAVKDSEPAELLDAYGRALLFAEHPYGRAVHGSESSLAAITPAHVRAYYRAHFGADRLLLVLAGDIDVDRAEAAVRAAFSAWPRAPAPLVPPAPLGTRPATRRTLLIDAPGATQSHFWIGAPGVPKNYPQRAALDLVNTLFGGRFTSLLNAELRIKSGLSYGARSGFVRGSAGGDFSIRSFVETAETGRAIRLALQALARLQGDGVSAEMLRSARAYTLGQYALGLETAADWAAALAEIEFFGLGTGYIDDYPEQLAAVDPQAARAVIAAAFPDPRDTVLVVIADAARISGQLDEFGPVLHMRLTDTQFNPTTGANPELS